MSDLEIWVRLAAGIAAASNDEEVWRNNRNPKGAALIAERVDALFLETKKRQYLIDVEGNLNPEYLPDD